MALNLIIDPWIPVRRVDGSAVVIAPWQMADAELAFPDWPRADLNLACLELLIGLVFLADPPADVDDWRDRRAPDPDRLRDRLAPFAPAFELLGDGPRFLQDREPLERAGATPNPPDMLFIDSAGGQTLRNNADLMVRRGRYPAPEFALAAMALYTLQAHAPSGGRGNRTSMRGGGPLVTLVDPGGGLWPLVWANVPDGQPAPVDALPWMRPTRTSEHGEQVFRNDSHPMEAFFGMPRRLRLLAESGQVTGVVQKPFGTNYAGWEHPLTPHYRVKAGGELLPRHPRAGPFGYRQWLGIVEKRPGNGADMARRAQMLDLWGLRARRLADVIVAGWAMDNMKPRDFVFSRAPLLDLPDDKAEALEGMVQAAELVSRQLAYALSPVLAEGAAREAGRESFYAATQATFEALATRLASAEADAAALAAEWLAWIRAAAHNIFDRIAMPGLGDRDSKAQAEIVASRRTLGIVCAGYGKAGRDIFAALGLAPPEQKRKGAA